MVGEMKDNNQKAKMPWILLAVAFVFIFNPNISIIDVLPDFIGYIIVSVALTRPSMISFCRQFREFTAKPSIRENSLWAQVKRSDTHTDSLN